MNCQSAGLRYRFFTATLAASMQSKASTVADYLAELPADRRSAIESVLAVIRKHVDPTYQEGMQYGMIGYSVPHSVYPPGYHCDPKQPLPFVCLASQKNYMSVYLGCVYGNPDQEEWFLEAWAKTGKKLDMGKACIHFKKVEDLALEVIGESIRRMPVPKYIQFYESTLKDARRKSNASKAAKSSKPKSAKNKPARVKREK